MHDKTLTDAAAALIEAGLPHPDDRLCQCGQRQFRHGGAAHRGGTAAGCRRFVYPPDMAMAVAAEHADGHDFQTSMKVFEWRQRNARKARQPGQWSVGPSDVAGCRRAIWYRNRPPEGFVPDPENKQAARMGGIIHDEVLRRRRALYPWRLYGDQRGREMYLPGMDRPCKYDEFDPVTGVLTSWKTAGEYKWDKTATTADQAWWDQETLYGLALTEAGYRVRQLRIEVIRRANGQSEQHIADETFATDTYGQIGYDPDRAQALLARLQSIATMLDIGQMLPRDRSGPTTDGICRGCFARSTCWPMQAAADAGVTPERYDLMGMTDDETAIEHLGLQRITAAAAESTAKGTKDGLDALLNGITPRVYGTVEAVEKPHTYVDWQAHARALVELFGLPADVRPSFTVVQQMQPPSRRSSKVTVQRLRAATIAAMKREAKAAEKAAKAAAKAAGAS